MVDEAESSCRAGHGSDEVVGDASRSCAGRRAAKVVGDGSAVLALDRAVAESSR